ncbi:sialic acid TRAP transporter substrate-binding protein SiaP [Photobacterium rosenbergii]|uniref:sialic acid TRAP transporter substrate-binding protein SiaP n=1 Tax=Photobacterium rosenbergii TaxID=294936 RepID=UPI001C99A908|nr:sialic acid TRAP transporter substrate-binding protein SiaP [Photobacterium rosenbergii]MBY5944646.1 sialic acid TRAP transporter substrate-binding protein SiaP [Photobacterium rosenbergii]
MKKLFTLSMIASALFTAQASASTQLKVGFNEAYNSPIYHGMVKAADELKTLSDGEMTLRLYEGGQLGNVHEMLEQVSLGELDMSMQVFGGYAQYLPRLGALETPYLVRDYDHLTAIFDSSWGMEARNELETVFNLKPIDSWFFGVRQTTSNKAINSLADMRGMKLRTPNAKALINYAKGVGAIPSPIAYAEVYLALQTNAVDGQENPISSIEAMKFYEVQPYLAMTNHVVQDQAISISAERWSSLSKQEQEWLMAALKAGGEEAEKRIKENTEAYLAKFKQAGVTVTHPDLADFRTAMKPYYQELDKEFGEGFTQTLMTVK